MPQTKKVVFFRTQSKNVSFLSAITETQTFLTGKRSVADFVTILEAPYFVTGNKSVTFMVTQSIAPYFLTPSRSVAFVVTPDPKAPRDLKLQIGTLTINTNQSIVNVADGTGTFDPGDPQLDPGGYNPEDASSEETRPKRSQLVLWTVFKLRSRPDSEGYGDTTITPVSQNEEEDNPYIYPLLLPTEDINKTTVPIKGLYEIFMIGAPFSQQGNYSIYYQTDLVSKAKGTSDWYITSMPIMVDADVTNCINKMRFAFLQGVMCGKCKDDYLEVYAIYVGLIAAMEIGEWPVAIQYYDRLKGICAGTDCVSCGC